MRKGSFKSLLPHDRRAFTNDPQNAGFLRRVVEALAEQGVIASRSTVCRTWNGKFKRPNPAIIAAIEAEYQRPRKRLSRVA